MAELITNPMRKAIKKMAEISQVARALNLMPNSEDFALRFIGDLKVISNMLNKISIRINDILDRYSNIPSEFLLKGFDEVLKGIDNISDYSNFTIQETLDLMSGVTNSFKNISSTVGSTASTLSSFVIQVGGGLSYATLGTGANILIRNKEGVRETLTSSVVQDAIDGNIPMDGMAEEFEKRIDDATGIIGDAADTLMETFKNFTETSTNSIDGAFNVVGNGIDVALDWIGNIKNDANKVVDDSSGFLIEKVENAKKEVEEKIEMVRRVFDNLTKNFDEGFGYLIPKNAVEDVFRNASNTAYEKMDTPVFDAVGEITGDIADFIKNFNVGKVITAFGGVVVGAASATLVMDLLPRIDVDRMLKDVIGGYDSYRVDKMLELYYNKYFEDNPNLLDEQDVTWLLNIDDLEKYNADAYNKFISEYDDVNNGIRSEILENMMKVNTVSDLSEVSKKNREKMKENKNKSALKAMRKIRRDVIKAKQIEKYKGFLKIELDYLKRECLNVKTSMKNEWDYMMDQYKNACDEIKIFFTTDGSGGNDAIDRCCDRINDDATQIVELCGDITKELTSAIAMIPTPYAIGTCVDMPVHKILSFFKDIKIIVTFLRNLIRLGIDIISQLTILVKIICNGLQSAKEIMDALKKLIGVDRILNMINYLVELFRPKMIDAKILLENSISPVYYNETEEYEEIMSSIEALLEDDVEGGTVKGFYYTDDIYSKDYSNTLIGGNLKNDDDIAEVLEKLEDRGEREIVAYRSPILNSEGDDFAGWIFYHAHAYDNMKTGWTDKKKRAKNKLILRASKKNKLALGKLIGGVAKLKKNNSFGYYNNDGKYVKNSVNGYDAYYWYTKWTNEPTDCVPDMKNEGKDVVIPIQNTANGSLVELSDGRRVFVEGKSVKSGDFVNVNGVKYKVK